jgi:hypothetical protein
VSFVPIADAHTDPAGDVVVHVPKDRVESAPRAELEDALHPEEERVLYEHYGRSDYGDWDRVDRTADLGLPAEPAPAEGEPVAVVRLRRVVVVGVGADAR